MREFEKIAVPEFPSITGLKKWQSQLSHNVIAAAGRKHDAPVAAWFYKTETAQTLDDLDSSPAWVKSIDMKLIRR